MCNVCGRTPCHPRCPNAFERQVVETCISCRDDILEGDMYYLVDGEPWCCRCMNKNRKIAEKEE